MDPDADTRTLLDEQRSLERGSRMGPLHWAVVACSVLITLAAWYQSGQFVKERAELRFEQERSRVLESVGEGLKRYEDLMLAGAGLFASQGTRVSRDEWREFVATMDLDTRYAGIDALSILFAVDEADLTDFVARQRTVQPRFSVHPVVDVPVHLPVTYVEPMAGNEKALGLDLMYEQTRVQTIQTTRDAGQARISGPVTLVQDKTQRPGFVFLMPLYSRRVSTVEERRKAFLGMVSAPFVARDLMDDVLDLSDRHVAVRVSDGDVIIHDELDPDSATHDADPLFNERSSLDLYGRRWHFDIQSDLTFRNYSGAGVPSLVLMTGLAIDAALLLLFMLLSNVNRRALDYVSRISGRLQHHMTSLERSNGELKSFAHVVSHDLKTPLRGIGDLVEYLGEDLEPFVAANDLPADVSKNLHRLDVQQKRMAALIEGILGYSALGRESVVMESLDVAEVLERLAVDFGIDDGRLEVRGQVPVFRTQALRFEQVMHNLIGNAIKYHEDVDKLRIVIEIEPTEGGWMFDVSDNGPGIDPQYHDSVFEVFQKLQSKDEIEGSGVGLSIVRRSAELIGGHVTLASTPGRGARFSVMWPDPSSAAGVDEPVALTAAPMLARGTG